LRIFQAKKTKSKCCTNPTQS